MEMVGKSFFEQGVQAATFPAWVYFAVMGLILLLVVIDYVRTIRKEIWK